MHSLYQQEIISRSQHPLFRGELDQATHSAEGANLSCGDEITFDAIILDGVLSSIRHRGRACAICTASADMLSELLTSKPQEDIQTITPEQVKEMLGIELSPIRLKCALLPLETLKRLTFKTS